MTQQNTTAAYSVVTKRGRVVLNTDDLSEARATLSSKRCPGNAYIQYNEDAIEEVQDFRNDVADATFEKQVPVYMNEDDDPGVEGMFMLTPQKLKAFQRDYTYEYAPRAPKMPYIRRGMARTIVTSQQMLERHVAQHNNGK